MSMRTQQNTQQALLVMQVATIAIALVALLLTANPERQLALTLLISGSAPTTGFVVSVLQLRRTRSVCSRRELIGSPTWTNTHEFLANAALRQTTNLIVACTVLAAMTIFSIKSSSVYAPLAIGGLYAVALLSSLSKSPKPMGRFIGAMILAMLALTIGALGAIEIAEEATLNPPTPIEALPTPVEAPATALPARCAVDPAAAVYEIEAGDTLWSISRAELTRYGEQPTDESVLELVNRLHELNIARLVEPENPDLIFPTDAIELVRQEAAKVAGC